MRASRRDAVVIAALCAAFIALLGAGVGAAPGGQRPQVDVPPAVDFVHPLPADLRPWFVHAGHFEALPAPGPHDWLANQSEPGQTYAQYLRSAPNKVAEPRTRLYLQPIGRLGGAALPSLETLERFVQAYFQVPASAQPAKTERALAAQQRKNPYDGHRQLLAPALLRQLKTLLPADGYGMIGLTAVDLYPDPSWNFVFGQALLHDRVSVHSFARYDPAFDAPTPLDKRRAVVLRRSLKVVAHEIGHMFGMAHCTHFLCLMNGSNHLEETDRAPLHLCPVCLRKLHWAADMDLATRYRALEKFYGAQGIEDEASWVGERILHATKP